MSMHYHVKNRKMLQIVTLHAEYLYEIAHLSITNPTESATWFNNYVVLNILVWKYQTTK